MEFSHEPLHSISTYKGLSMIVKDFFRNFHLSLNGLESRAQNKLRTEKLSQSPGENEGVKINQKIIQKF